MNTTLLPRVAAKPLDNEIPHHAQGPPPTICKARPAYQQEAPLVLADLEAPFVYSCTKITFLLQRIGRVLPMVQKSKLMNAIELAASTYITHIFPEITHFTADFSMSSTVLESLIGLAGLCFQGPDDLPLQFQMAAIRTLLNGREQIASMLASSLTYSPEILATTLAKLEMVNIFGPVETPRILRAMEAAAVPLTLGEMLACDDFGTLKIRLDLENIQDQDLLDSLEADADDADKCASSKVDADTLPTSTSTLSSAGSSAPDLSYLNDYSLSLSPPSLPASPTVSSAYPRASQSLPAPLAQELRPLLPRRSISPNTKLRIPNLVINVPDSGSNLAIRRSNLGYASSHNSKPASDVPQTPLFTPIISWDPLINPDELITLPGADQPSPTPTRCTPMSPSSSLSPPPSSDQEPAQEPTLQLSEAQNTPTCAQTLELEEKVICRQRSASYSNASSSVPQRRYGLRSVSLSQRARACGKREPYGHHEDIDPGTTSSPSPATLSKKARGRERAGSLSQAKAPRTKLRARRMRAVSSNKENQE